MPMILTDSKNSTDSRNPGAESARAANGADLEYEGISTRNTELLTRVVGAKLMDLVKDAPLEESVVGLQRFIGGAKQAIEAIEGVEARGVTLLPAAADVRNISDLGRRITADGPDIWLRKGNHPEMETVIETRQALAHEIRDVRILLHEELRAIEIRAFPAWKEMESHEGATLLEREKRRDALLSDAMTDLRNEWEADGSLTPLRESLRRAIDRELESGYLLPMSEEGVAREVLRTFDARTDSRVEPIERAIEQALGTTKTPAEILRSEGHDDLAAEYSRRADRARLHYVNQEIDRRIEGKLVEELERRRDPVLEAVMREEREDQARVRLATDRVAPRGIGEGRTYDILVRAGEAELADRYLGLSRQFEIVNDMYVENLTRLKELRFYHFHATNVNNGAEVREVLSEKEMNALYPQGRDWINPHEAGWPVIHYAVDYRRTMELGGKPSAFDTARGFDTLQAPGVGTNLMESRRDGKWSFPGNTAALLNPYSSRSSTFAETAATPLTAGRSAEKGAHGIGNNTAQFYEKKAMITPDHPRREFYLSMIGGLESNTLDGSVVTERGTLVYLKPPITPTDTSPLVPSSRAQIYDPPKIIVPKRDETGAVIAKDDGGIEVEPGPSQGMRRDDHRVRAVEAVEAMKIPGFENAALTLQRRIARELFVPQREQWDEGKFDRDSYVAKWTELEEALTRSRGDALAKLTEGIDLPYDSSELSALRAGGDPAAYQSAMRETAKALSDAGLLETYQHSAAQYAILENEMEKLSPQAILPRYGADGRWQGAYPATKPKDPSERRPVFGADL